MDAHTAAQLTSSAILDANSAFPSKQRMQAVRKHCLGTESRISSLEEEVRDLQSKLEAAYEILRHVVPVLPDD